MSKKKKNKNKNKYNYNRNSNRSIYIVLANHKHVSICQYEHVVRLALAFSSASQSFEHSFRLLVLFERGINKL